MRLSYYAYFAAIIAVTFVSSGNTVAATDDGISAMTLPNAVEATVGGEKRSLRSHNNKNLEDESDDEALYDEEDEEDEEERTRGDKMFTAEKLDDAANGSQLISRFKKWVEFKYNPQRLPAALRDDKYTELRQKFRTWYYHRRQQ